MFFDLTHTLTHNMPTYPGDIPCSLQQLSSIEQNGYMQYILNTNLHVGTHIDAPSHMFKDGKNISNFPLNQFCGPGKVLNAQGQHIIDCNVLKNTTLEKDSIVLIWTGHDKKFYTEEYYYNYPELSLELAQTLIEHKIKLIGIDTPSPDKFPFMIHKLFLKYDIPIIENLTNLDNLLDTPKFDVYAFPLRITADASPVRVVAQVYL